MSTGKSRPGEASTTLADISNKRLKKCFGRVIAKKLTLNCSWKEEDVSTMPDDAQTGGLRGLWVPVSEMKKPASEDRLFIDRNSTEAAWFD